MYPTIFNIYKSKAAAQFTLLPPRRDENNRISKTGAVLLEVAPSAGEKTYDWRNSKLTFAFGISDLTAFFDDPNSSNWGSFYHKNDTVVKRLSFSPGEGQYEGTYMLSLSSGDSRVSIPLSSGEFQVLGRLFTAALPKMLGW